MDSENVPQETWTLHILLIKPRFISCATLAQVSQMRTSQFLPTVQNLDENVLWKFKPCMISQLIFTLVWFNWAMLVGHLSFYCYGTSFFSPLELFCLNVLWTISLNFEPGTFGCLTWDLSFEPCWHPVYNAECYIEHWLGGPRQMERLHNVIRGGDLIDFYCGCCLSGQGVHNPGTQV